MSDWALYLIIWWGVWYTILLTWYRREMDKGMKDRMHPMVAFFLFLMAGIAFPLMVILIIVKAIRR